MDNTNPETNGKHWKTFVTPSDPSTPTSKRSTPAPNTPTSKRSTPAPNTPTSKRSTPAPNTPTFKRNTPAPNTPHQYLRSHHLNSPLVGRTAKSTPNSPLVGRIARSTPNSPALSRAQNSSSKVFHHFDGQTTPIPLINDIKILESAPPSPSMSINRIAYNVEVFNESYLPIETHKTTTERFKKFKPDFSKKAWIRRIKTLFPILVWLPNYDVKNNLLADIIVGITIASFQVPQSIYITLFLITIV
jgi:hypothetical protein